MFKKKKNNRSTYKKNRRSGEAFSRKFLRSLLVHLKVVAFSFAIPVCGLLMWKLYEQVLVSPVLAIEKISINGNYYVEKDEIMEISEIYQRVNLLSVDEDFVKSSLNMHPYIKDVKVEKKMPSEIVLNITERVPLAFVLTEKILIMDKDGVLFKEYSVKDKLDLPVITGFEKEELEGEFFKKNILTLLTYLEKNEGFSYDKISEINYHPVYGYTIITNPEGVRIELGRNDIYERIEKFYKFVALRKENLSNIERVNLMTDKGIIVKFNKMKDNLI